MISLTDSKPFAPALIDEQIPGFLGGRSLWPKRGVYGVVARAVNIMDTRLADIVCAELHLYDRVAIVQYPLRNGMDAVSVGMRLKRPLPGPERGDNVNKVMWLYQNHLLSQSCPMRKFNECQQ